MIRVFLVLALVSGISHFALSQFVNPGKAMISYYDGSFFVGNLLKDSGYEWELRLTTGDTVHLNPDMIKRMMTDSEVFLYSKQKYHAKKSYFINTSWGLHGGWEASFLWDFMAGMSLTENVDIGAGVGASMHDLDLGDNWLYNDYYNTYVYGRYFLNSHFLRLYVDLNAGYAFAIQDIWDDAYDGGVYLQPGIGILLASKGPVKWNFGLSQYLSRTTGSTTSFFNGNPVEVGYDLWYNRTMFEIGINLMILPKTLNNAHF